MLIGASALALAACGEQASETTESNESLEAPAALTYPATATVDHVDNYHGTEVADPYRWLEDDVRESEAVAAWVAAQNEVTSAYLATIPERSRIKDRLTELWNYERYSLPFDEGGRYFFTRNDGLQNQSVLYTMDRLDGEARVVIDPNTWSDDGTIALSGISPSPDGRFLAYGIQDGGSDWRVWRVLNLENGEELSDELRWIKFSGISWELDGSGFYYSRYPAPEEGQTFQSLNVNMKIYFHGIGTEQADDRLIYEQPDHPEWGPRAEVTEDGFYLLITTSIGTDARYNLDLIDLSADDSTPVSLVSGFENDYRLIDNDGHIFFFLTNRDAPRNRVIAIDVNQPGQENWQEIIAEDEAVLRSASLVGRHFFAQYMVDVKSAVKIFEMDGTPEGEVALPGLGSAFGFDGGAASPITFYSFSSFNTPPTSYQYNVLTGESSVFHSPEVAFDPADFVVAQIFYNSKDGTRIPMFIAHKAGLEKSGDTPTLLYGYGGFNIPLRPNFSPRWLSWMEMGGVFALANIRGGSEYGEEWHQAGTKARKQNVFDDFIAAGEFLIAEGYTNTSKLAIMGGSNGGLLVGAVLNQRPDLFGAALPAVGVMDMLRFHKFTAGRFWTDDYGSSDNADEFEALYAYSPYHNLVPQVYPPILATTADTDDRVVPGHSFKYVARLQAVQQGTAPTLIRIETRAGHGSGKPTAKIIEELADQWGFLVKNLGMELPEGYGAAKADTSD